MPKQALPPKIVYKTDTAVIITNNKEIVKAIDELGNKAANTLTTLQDAKDKADKDDRLIKWATNDGVFSVGVTLLVFILGILIDRLYKWNEARVERKELRRYFIAQVEKILIKVGLPLSKGYKKIIETTTIDSGIGTTPPKVLSGEIKRVNEVGTNELYKAISNHESLSIILSEVDFLEGLQIEVENYHLYTRNSTQKLRTELKNLIEIYLESIANTVKLHKKSNSKPKVINPDIDFLNGMLLKFHSEISGKRELKKFYEEIVRPIQEKIVFENLYTDQNWGKIAEEGKKISLNYNELDGIMNEFIAQYDQFYTLLEDANNKLSTHLGVLKRKEQ